MRRLGRRDHFQRSLAGYSIGEREYHAAGPHPAYAYGERPGANPLDLLSEAANGYGRADRQYRAYDDDDDPAPAPIIRESLTLNPDAR
jgi:hypothetical protein